MIPCLRIVLGLALLAVGAVLMGAHLLGLLRDR